MDRIPAKQLVALFSAAQSLAAMDRVTGGQTAAVADLRDPTVKKSLVVSHDVLERYVELPMQDLLQEIGGFRDISDREVDSYFEEYLPILDAAIDCRNSPFVFADFVSTDPRELIRAGIVDMIRAGHRREVMSYLTFVSWAALVVIDNDASESVKHEAMKAYSHFMGYLGIPNEEDYRNRSDKTREALIELKATTDRIIQANPNAID